MAVTLAISLKVAEAETVALRVNIPLGRFNAGVSLTVMAGVTVSVSLMVSVSGVGSVESEAWIVIG